MAETASQKFMAHMASMEGENQDMGCREMHLFLVYPRLVLEWQAPSSHYSTFTQARCCSLHFALQLPSTSIRFTSYLRRMPSHRLPHASTIKATAMEYHEPIIIDSDGPAPMARMVPMDVDIDGQKQSTVVERIDCKQSHH